LLREYKVNKYQINSTDHAYYRGIAQELIFCLKPSFSNANIRFNMFLIYEARGALPTDYDITMGSNIGRQAAQLLMENITGGRFVGCTNNMNPLTDAPVVLELTGISDGNNLGNTAIYDTVTLRANGLLVLNTQQIAPSMVSPIADLSVINNEDLDD